MTIPKGWRRCPRCEGAGRLVTVLWTLPCPDCDGTGLVVKTAKEKA